MHLLLAQKGTIAEGTEGIDLGQTPGDVLFLSAADTELASLGMAQRQAGNGLSLRLANMMALAHPMSVDAYIERTAQYSKLIVVRIMGRAKAIGLTGWKRSTPRAVNHKVHLAVLPGDDKPDPGLDRFSTVTRQDRDALWHYLLEGGAQNAHRFLDYCAAMINGGDKPQEAAPLLKAGLWWPGSSAPSLTELRKHWVADAPIVAICFYRALVQSGQMQPVEALVSALKAKGLNPLPVFVSSLKDPVSVATLTGIFNEAAPAVVLNATGFAVSVPGASRKPTVLEHDDAMVLQVIFSGSSVDQWRNSDQGLSARDLAMNVALPETRWPGFIARGVVQIRTSL